MTTKAPTPATPRTTPAFLWALGVLIVTTVHHIYGAELYGTPERYHAVVIAAGALLLMAAGLGIRQRWRGRRAESWGWWLFWASSATIPVLLFGLVEGFYNHTLKVLLWAVGVSGPSLRRLYPDPTFELPNDLLFELTGVLHVVPAAFAAYHLVQLVRVRGAR
jgi:hypothetical protein